MKNCFDYGNELQYKIEDVTSKSKDDYTLHCHAREMWALVKFLPFILRKLLSPHNVLYKFGLLMVDLLDIAFKTSFSLTDIEKLENVITQHHREFLRLFKRSLTPKFHLLTHYSRVIRQSGPLKYLWCMRFEAKHQHLKSQAKIMYSRRNTCLTFAKKNCFQNALSALCNEGFKDIHNYTRSREEIDKEFKEILKENYVYSKINYLGTIFTPNKYFISNCLQFAWKIRQITMDKSKENIMFIVEKYEIEYVDELRSFKICESAKTLKCLITKQLSTPPLNQHLFQNNFYLRQENYF